jgi:hypothetical protein
MQPALFDETLAAFRKRAPFRPFTVALVNGDRLEVDHADALVVRDGVAIFVAAGRQPEPVKITGSGIATSPGR